MFEKKNKVVRILRTPAGETGSIHKIAKKNGDRVQCVGDETLWYDANTGKELDPAPGFAAAGITSRLIHCE